MLSEEGREAALMVLRAFAETPGLGAVGTWRGWATMERALASAAAGEQIALDWFDGQVADTRAHVEKTRRCHGRAVSGERCPDGTELVDYAGRVVKCACGALTWSRPTLALALRVLMRQQITALRVFLVLREIARAEFARANPYPKARDPEAN